MAIAYRRLFLVAFACLATHAFAQEKAGPIRSVEITQNDEGYVATIVMQPPVPPKVAWDVLTDFAQHGEVGAERA